MGQAICQQNLHPRSQLRSIARERVTHLNRRAQVLGTLLQNLGKVLAGMLASGEVQRNLPTLAGGHNAAGEYARALVRRFARETLTSHAGGVVVYHLTLRRLPD